MNLTKILLGKDKWELSDWLNLGLLAVFVALIAFITIKLYTPAA